MNIQKVPRHIGIVMDGNRRFARKLMLKPWMGHEWGKGKVEKLFEWAKEYKIQELTIYTFSIQNFNRPEKEFNYLMDLFVKSYKELDENLIKEVKVNFVGRTHMFPKKVKEAMDELTKKTKNNKPYVINFAMAYGGQEEILDAVKKIGEQIKKGNLNINEINHETFKNCLDLKSSPELIIRTGGEKRTSNFLNYQSAYSEWIFLSKTWPEFEKEDFVDCLKNYSERKRRFGR